MMEMIIIKSVLGLCLFIVLAAVLDSIFELNLKALLNPPDAPKAIVTEIKPEPKIYLLPAKFEEIERVK